MLETHSGGKGEEKTGACTHGALAREQWKRREGRRGSRVDVNALTLAESLVVALEYWPSQALWIMKLGDWRSLTAGRLNAGEERADWASSQSVTSALQPSC